jgi:hypothetical protein
MSVAIVPKAVPEKKPIKFSNLLLGAGEHFPPTFVLLIFPPF